jgi:hypothetical protein
MKDEPGSGLANPRRRAEWEGAYQAELLPPLHFILTYLQQRPHALYPEVNRRKLIASSFACQPTLNHCIDLGTPCGQGPRTNFGRYD